MCAQCMATATTAAAAATGLRAWLAAHTGGWLCERRLRIITRALIGLALVAAAVFSSGTG